MLDNRKNFITSVAGLLIISGIILMNIMKIHGVHYSDNVVMVIKLNGAIFIFVGIMFFVNRGK